MVAAASAWAAAYNNNETEPRWRKKLHTWISDVGWLTDPPLPYVDRKAAAIANKRAGKAKGKGATAPAAKGKVTTTRAAKAKAKAPAAKAATPPWTNVNEWIDRYCAHDSEDERLGVLCDWVRAAGGRVDSSALHIPSTLATSPVLKEIKALARELGVAIRTPVAAGGKIKSPAAGGRKATAASLSADVRATKPAFGSASHEWLRGRVKSGALSVTGIAQLFSVSEQKIQSVLDGRATFTDAKWSELKSAALTSPTPPAEPPTLPKASPPTPAPPAPNWADHAAWAARFDGACSTREHHTVIGEWAESAGGYVGGFDNDQIWLPAGCRADPAWQEIADRARALGLDVHTDPPARTIASTSQPGSPQRPVAAS